MSRFNRIKETLFRLSNVRKEYYNRWWRKGERDARGIDLSGIRTGPVVSGDTSGVARQHCIPVGRATVMRHLSQTGFSSSGEEQELFEEVCRLLEACVWTRSSYLGRQLRAGYTRLDPDRGSKDNGDIPGNRTDEVAALLDAEHDFMRRMGRAFSLASYREANRCDLSRWLLRHSSLGGTTAVMRFAAAEVSVDPSQYELLKVWVLSRCGGVSGYHESHGNKRGLGRFINTTALRSAIERYVPFVGNPYRIGNRYRRVAIATREMKRDRVELRMYNELSEGEFVHALPHVTLEQSRLDSAVLFGTGALFSTGLLAQALLPAASVEAGWLLISSHQLAASLSFLSAAVALLTWHVIQRKRSLYWQWRSQLNYRSITASNRGVIGLLIDRLHDELFKQSILAYARITSHPYGISQKELESDIKNWAQANCSAEFKEVSDDLEVNLTEALSLLRQLNIVFLDPSSQLLTAKPLESAIAVLGAEFGSCNLLQELDGSTVIRRDIGDQFVFESVYEDREDKKVASMDQRS